MNVRRRAREGGLEPDGAGGAEPVQMGRQAAFARLSPSQRLEYVEGIVEAKREATRDRRIATAIEWIAGGKPRNWKYMKR